MRSTTRSSVTRSQAAMLAALAMPAVILDDAGAVRLANEAWSASFGVDGKNPVRLDAALSEEDRTRVKRELENALLIGRTTQIEFEAYRHDGTMGSFVCSAGPLDDEATGERLLLCILSDVTDQQRQAQRLSFMAGHDPLTGLANRRALQEALGHSVVRVQRGGRAAVAIVDMDGLKAFNDEGGHLAGDQALVNLAMLIRHHVRAGDLPARIGGDEFAILLEDVDEFGARDMAERIRASAAEEEFVPGAREHGLTVSIGIANVEQGVDARTVLDRADAALYAAKAAGRNRVVVWTTEVAFPYAGDSLADDVRHAFAEDGFSLVYQPVLRLADMSVAYFESFVRMASENGSAFGPRQFLPAVERLGLMSQLTRRTLEMALWDLAAVPEACVSLNLAGSDLNDSDLLAEVADFIERAKSAKGRVLFEVGESALLANLEGGRAWLDTLTPLGVRFVLDDFGSGVGMFVLLREPRIEQVKLSQTVMRAMTAEERNRVFISALRELIETQGKTAVASFLEDDRLLRGAQLAGFTWGQGFGLAEPASDLAAVVAEGRAQPRPSES